MINKRNSHLEGVSHAHLVRVPKEGASHISLKLEERSPAHRVVSRTLPLKSIECLPLPYGRPWNLRIEKRVDPKLVADCFATMDRDKLWGWDGTVDVKKRFYGELADRLHQQLRVRLEDVFISLVEVRKENWSFGNGEAQYAA